MSGDLLRIRDGVPRFAAKLAAGESATIVAFGTSMTLFGHYLTHLPAALEAAAPGASVRLVNRGLRGLVTLSGAFRVAGDVVPLEPDLVLIEFAHNESTPDALGYIPAALDGIVAQVRRARPACEFAFVYLAQAGAAAAGPTPAMLVHENIAAYYRFPSFDLASLSEERVAAGLVSWRGDGAPALTYDGIHHTPLAADVLGKPFAEAFVDLVRRSDAIPAPPRPVPNRSLSGASRVSASRFIGAGSWAVGIPHNHDARNAQAYEENVAEALAPGATLDIPFSGSRLFAWLMGNGRVRVVVGDSAEDDHFDVVTGKIWDFFAISPTLDDGSYVLHLTVVQPPIVFGDIYIVGIPPG